MAQQQATVALDAMRLSKPNVDLKQWINEALRNVSNADANASTSPRGGNGPVTDTHVTQLLTRLQLHQQETATSLEDTISQAVVRLPRVAMEVERMGKEAQELSVRLADSASKAAAVVQRVPVDASRLQQLRTTKEKLSRCARVLQKAKMLGLQLDELEGAARSGTTKPQSKSSGDETAASHDMESIATAVADVHGSLQEVQSVDPTFGAAMETRLRTLEAELQRNVERDCLDLLKRQEKTRAPKLLAALRKIHRDGHVMQQYLAHVVSTRKAQLGTELRTISSGPHAVGTSAAGGGDVVIAFGQHYRSLGKVFVKEVEYLELLYATETSGALGEVCATLVEKLCSSTTDVIADALQSVDCNEVLVGCFDALTAELSKSTAPHGKDNRIDALVDACRRPYESLVPRFVQRACKTISSAMSVGAPGMEYRSSTFRNGVEQMIASLDRCMKFYADQTVPPVLELCTQSVQRALNELSRIDVTSSSTPSTVQVQQAFRQHAEYCAAVRSLGSLTDVGNGWLSTAPKVGATPVPLSVFSAASQQIQQTEAASREKCLAAVCTTMMRPFSSTLAEYITFHVWSGSEGGVKGAKSLAAFNAGQVAPSDLIRQFGADLMELPMTLESVEGDIVQQEEEDGDAVQAWLGRVVAEVVRLFLADVNKIVVHPSRPTHGHVGDGAQPSVVPALEQLACDFEYLSNVLAAVSEATFDETLGAAIRQLQSEIANLKSPGATTSKTPFPLATILK